MTGTYLQNCAAGRGWTKCGLTFFRTDGPEKYFDVQKTQSFQHFASMDKYAHRESKWAGQGV